MHRFHEHTGKLVILNADRTTAERNHASEEFNDGMVFSDRPLKDNEIFSVQINKRISSWSGSIEIGFVTTDPADIDIPKGAIALRHGTWVISGTSVNVDGSTIKEDYCSDLDSLNRGSVVSIMRNKSHEIHLFIDGEDQGIAAICTSPRVWVVIDLYGKCSNVSIKQPTNDPNLTNENAQEGLQSIYDLSFPDNTPPPFVFTSNCNQKHSSIQSFAHKMEPLSFHAKCGSLIRLTDDRRTAVRRHHQDEFNNGVVMTNRTLENNEMFEIRINTLIEKWSGSIEMGITTHAPDLLEIPSTMTNLRSGTVMLSGCGIITNGKGTRKEYLDFHLDKLKIGHRIGLMRKSEGTLHYFINGVDQGVAANSIPPHVYGVVDLYGMAVSVSIVPSYSVFERTYRNEAIAARMLIEPGMFQEHEPMLFNTHCGKHVVLSENRRSAKRKNPIEDFNYAVVPTERQLKPGEIFTIQVDGVVEKWSGSLEIGVTTNDPKKLEFPATMTNVRTGTWIMTATGVMCNGVTVVDDYGSNLESLKIGDRLGVCRKSNGNLHFFINGVDQGLAASQVPENVYGVVDLYGQASEASIVDMNKKDEYPVPSPTEISHPTTGNPLNPLSYCKLNPLSGKYCALTKNLNCAYRKKASFVYDNCVFLGSQLNPGQLVEFRVDKIIPHWTGSLEIGVTGLRNLTDFPESLTELKSQTWVWTGSSILENGKIVKDFQYDTENLTEGSRIGLMLTDEGKIRGFFDGSDIGVVFPNCPSSCVYPILNLYGKSAQVTLLGQRAGIRNESNIFSASNRSILEVDGYTVLKNRHRFHHGCDNSIILLNQNRVATRNKESHAPLLFSANFLKIGDLFEIGVLDVIAEKSGSLSIGLVSTKNKNVKSLVTAYPSVSDIRHSNAACLIDGNSVYSKGSQRKEYYLPSLNHLNVGDKVGITLGEDESVKLTFNGVELENAAEGLLLSESFHVFVCMGPRVSSIEVLNTSANLKELKGPPSLSDSSSDEGQQENSVKSPRVPEPHMYPFSKEICGKNIRLSEDGLTATRVGSYNQAIVITLEPLRINKLFQIKVKNLDEKWKSSLSIGVTSVSLLGVKLPVDSLKLSKLTWIIHGDSVYKNGKKIVEKYIEPLDSVQPSQILGLLLDRERNLHLYIDGIDQGVAVRALPEDCHGVVDLYGTCDEIEVTKDFDPGKKTKKLEKEDCVKEGQLDYHLKDDISCPFRMASTQFLDTLSLPNAFFSGDITCYCNSCFKSSGEPLYRQQGDPSLLYALPVGWCAFDLRVHPNVDIGMVSKSWNIAYFGTKVGAVRKLLDLGEIPTDNAPIWDLRVNGAVDEEDHQTRKRIPAVSSPLIPQATDEKASPRFKFVDEVAKPEKSYFTKLAFQFFVQPNTFKIKTSSSLSELGSSSNADSMEWIVKQPGTTILSRLLVKLEEAQKP